MDPRRGGLVPRTPGEPDGLRAWRPRVLEEADATLRMGYAGTDGTTSTILTARRPLGGGWERLGVAIDTGFAGDSDSYGARRRGARLQHLIRAVPRSLVALKWAYLDRFTRVTPKRYMRNCVQQGPDAKVGLCPLLP